MIMIRTTHLTGMFTGLILSGTVGCSSMMSHSATYQGYYPGTRASASMLSNQQTDLTLKSLALIDLPFSAALDTLLLPWDYFHARNKTSNSLRSRVINAEKETCAPQNRIIAATPRPESH